MIRSRPVAGALFACAALVAAGCRQDMHDQPKVKPLAESTFFANGSGSRVPPSGAVARGQLRLDRELETGRHADDSMLAALPAAEQERFEADRHAYLARGRQRFDIFCSPCHGKLGAGDGMVVQRGYKQPPSYHIDRLRQVPIGYIFDVTSNGFGVMPSYSAQVSVQDRWAIAVYVRTLQLSQHFDPSLLSADERHHLDAPPAAAGEEHAEPAHSAH